MGHEVLHYPADNNSPYGQDVHLVSEEQLTHKLEHYKHNPLKE